MHHWLLQMDAPEFTL